MSSNKFFVIGIAAVLIVIVLLACWWAGYFDSAKDGKEENSTSLSDKNIGTLEMDKAYEAMKKFKSEFDENLFKELTHSLRSLSSASDETLKKFVEKNVDTADEEQKKKDIASKTEKVKANIKKINDEFFGATDKYDVYINRFYNISVEKKDGVFNVTVSSDKLELLTKYDDFITANVTANPTKLSDESKKAVTEEKYNVSADKKISSMKIMAINFINFILA